MRRLDIEVDFYSPKVDDKKYCNLHQTFDDISQKDVLMDFVFEMLVRKYKSFWTLELSSLLDPGH